MRIAIGGIVHETNTYADASSGLTGLESFDVRRGDEMLSFAKTRSFVGGMLAGAEAGEHEVVPVVHAFAQPSGTIRADVYRDLKDELVTGIAAALPVDAVVLDTHGAGVVEGIDDLEGDLGAAVRELIGPDIPLLTVLDLHGNMTDAMNEAFDMMLGVYDYPHVDMFERGVEAIDAAERIVSGEWTPTTHIETIPMLVPTSTTDRSPARDIRQLCIDVGDEPDVLRGAFFHGFPFTDVPATGASIVLTTNGDRDLAKATAQRLAVAVWERRDDFLVESLSPEVAIRRAMTIIAERGGPVVINDTADNPGAGSPGDSTHVLRALIEAAPANACFGYIFDPAVADQAVEAGPGATIDVALGGKHGPIGGEPIKMSVYVKSVTDGSFVCTSPMVAGYRLQLGPMARLQVDGPGGLDVLVGSARSQVFDHEVFLLHGIDVERYDLVVLKSSQHFRAGFAELATEIITADSPGLSTLRVDHFEHQRADGPRWPIDQIDWAPAP